MPRATKWPEGTRVRVPISGWEGDVTRVLKARSGSGAVRVHWDKATIPEKYQGIAAATSVVSNPDLNLERI